MINKRKKIFILFILLSIVIFNLAAEDDLSLRTGICLFDYDTEAESSIANGVSASFFEILQHVSEHRLGSLEIKSILTENKNEEVVKILLELEKLYSARDEIIFSESKVDISDKLDEKDIEIEKKKLELSVIEDEISGIEDSIEKDSFTIMPIVFVQPDDGRFFTREPGAIIETAEKNNLDLLIYGFIERLDDYRYIEVRLWNNMIKEDSAIWRTAVSSDDINALIIDGQNLIKTKLLGREWAELTIKGPDNSLIYIDGKFSGIGSISGMIRNPGNINVEVKKNGYKPLTKTAILESFTKTVLDFQLEHSENRSVVIQTFPSKADIYLDSVWIGLSPVRFEPETETSAIRIKKDGYVDKSFFIDERTEKLVNVNLKADSTSRADWVPDARKRFYNGFGTFILSIPFTALFYSMVEQTGVAYQSEYSSNGIENYDELIRLQNLNNAQYGLYLASLGLNIIMFLDTIIHAIEYVDSVEYFSF